MRSEALCFEPSDERPLEDIEDEIATLAATITAATYRLLYLLGEIDRRGGWSDPLDSRGFRSAAHWLSWRVGMDLGTARQHVRVARRLPELPRISAAFEAGEVSYSKVRAMTRIATLENEGELLCWARACSACQLENLVRRYRKAAPAGERARAAAHQEGRHLQTYYDADGMLVVKGRLPPEVGAMLVKALEQSADALRQDEDG